jgi:DNA polymerase-1
VNLQQIPQEDDERGVHLREAFKARERKKLVVFDLSQAELRVTAHLTQDNKLMEVYLSDLDLHTTTMENLECERKVAKQFNFSSLYGATTKTMKDRLHFKAGIRLDYDTVDTYRIRWYELYKGIDVWKAKVYEDAERDGFVINAFGRKRRLPEIWSNKCTKRRDGSLYFPEREKAKRQAANFLIQSYVGDVMKRVMIRLHDELKKYDAYMILQVHDEVVVECPEKTADAVCRLCEQIATQTCTMSVPLKADAHAADNWAAAKSG